MTLVPTLGVTSFLLIALVLALPVTAADDYYLRDEQSRWVTSSGEPVKGVRMSDRLVCEADRGCIDLRYIRGDYPYQLTERQQRAYEQALRQLDFEPGDPVSLPPDVGREIYRAAERGWERKLRQD